MEEVANSIDGLVEALTTGIIGDSSYLAFLIVAFILSMIFWKGGIVLKAIGVSLSLVYGFTMAASQDVYSGMWVAGLSIALIGLCFLYDIVMEVWKNKSKRSTQEGK